MSKPRTTRRSPGPRRGKTRAAARMGWVPEVSSSGELFLKRAQRTDGERPGKLSYPFAQGLTFVARRWRNLMNEELRGLGQSQARWSALYWIEVFGDTLNQTELADRIGVEQPTLGRVLKDLEREGLIERIVGPTDRRDKVIRLTPAARPVMREINRIQNSVRKRLLRGIDSRDLETCVAVFARILSNFERG